MTEFQELIKDAPKFVSMERGELVARAYAMYAAAAKTDAENASLREAAERDADVMEALNLSLEESQAENAKLMELCKDLYGQVKTDDSAWEIIRRREDELPCYADHIIASYDYSLGKVRIADGFADRMRELGIEVSE